MSPPIDAAEFDAHKDLSTVIAQYLCRNKDRGFSAKEISEATGIPEADVTNCLLKIGLADVVSKFSGRTRNFKIEDVTVNGTIYYRCVAVSDS
jgi:hypothetical protein